ncbi:porin family protein [Shewanella intestini]|uniref:Porin family protein n=1 Tax=Shewanella intestini TaxID=2017544 RepID=A0ABS5I2V0_9GAMM|nr:MULTISPECIES: porin family protein [Shewanella]MBR9728352.1 porin family protein [Shewanella intestini]MRG36694.1 outer membrane beta-barrel protein [Shewanella sp. XMDDZSB0408]
MKSLSIAAAAVVISMSAPALAEQAPTHNSDNGFYVGGSVSQMTLKDSDDHHSESGAGVGVYGGYQFNHWFALEANLAVSGDLNDNSDTDITAGTLAITPVFTYQFNDVLAAYAKVGVASMAVVADPNYSDDITYSGIGFAYGAGIKAALTDNLYLRVSYDISTGNVEDDDSNDDFDVDIKQFALGMHYQF